MKNVLTKTIAIAGLLGISSFTYAKPLTEAQARTAIAPLYTTFSQPVQGDVATLIHQGTTADWQSCASETDCRGQEKSIAVFTGFGKMIPNMHHTIKQIVVQGQNVVVRGELSGTPAGDFFGVPHSGKSFTIMTMDTHVIKNGKIAHTYHIEDWASAIRQLSSK